MEHTLTITADAQAYCSCGEAISIGLSSAEAAAIWDSHVKVPVLLETLREQVELEYRTKQTVEATVRELAKLGVTTRIISDNTVVDGTTVISPTIAQRLVKHPTEKPRRRYTRKAAESSPKKTVKKTTTKKV